MRSAVTLSCGSGSSWPTWVWRTGWPPATAIAAAPLRERPGSLLSSAGRAGEPALAVVGQVLVGDQVEDPPGLLEAVGHLAHHRQGRGAGVGQPVPAPAQPGARPAERSSRDACTGPKPRASV